jgi:hypothetical protein
MLLMFELGDFDFALRFIVLAFEHFVINDASFEWFGFMVIRDA